MARAFIGVGSNQGNRLAAISHAMRILARAPGVMLVQMATVAETKPVGGPPQDDYLNTVIEVDVEHEPQVLLRLLQDIERQLGREPGGERWGPRPIDLDLLLFENRLIVDPLLQVPHPRLHERRFVLEPLAQIAPHLRHPVLQQTIADLLSQLPQEKSVQSFMSSMTCCRQIEDHRTIAPLNY
jgi:2-amino-4-hydroxy-6-hydroxymethyldihydropteridine diphosphokinase